MQSMQYMPAGAPKIDDYPLVTFKLGTGETKSDREWLKKKKEYYEKEWAKDGQKVLKKIADSCGYTFPDASKHEGHIVILHKKPPVCQIIGVISDENPLEVNLYIAKNDTQDTLKELLIRMLVSSFIQQQYEFHFRMREQTLFEDILADELLAFKVSFAITGRKLSRSICVEALDQAVAQTVYRLSQKAPRNKLVELLYGYFQENPIKAKREERDVLAVREELVAKLLEFLPKSVNVYRE
jgi:hypothetical protein